jgi:hypothetical protein
MRRICGLFTSLALVAAFGLACGDDDNPPTPDKGIVDQAVQGETSPWPDLGVPDGTPQPDQATGDMALDTVADDMATGDTTTTDTTTTDTASTGDASVATNTKCSAPQVITLTGTKTTVTGDTTGAPDEFGTSIDCGNSLGPWPGPNLYYKVTLAAGKKYLVTMAPSGSGFDSAVFAFPAATACTATAIDAACVSYNSDVGGTSAESFVITTTTAGDWIIVADSWISSAFGPFGLTIEEIAKPANDTCAAAKLLSFTSGKLSETGNTMAANNTVKLTATDCTSNTTNGPDVFFKVTLTKDNSYKFALSSSSFNGALYAFTSCTGVAGSCGTGMGADASTGSSEQITFKAATTGTYTIGIAGRSATDSGAFTLTGEEYAPITNNTCATAKAITITAGKGTTNGHTVGATASVNLPTTGCTGDDTEGGDVWHKVTLTAGKNYLVTSSPGSSFDHAIYMLSSCTNPTTTCVAGDDSEWSGDAEYFTFKPTTTGTYYIAVDSGYATTASAGAGAYDLTVQEYATPPVNDTCATAKVVTLTAGKATVSGLKIGATDSLAKCGTQSTTATDIFYKFTPTVGKKYKITFKPQGSGGRYGVWDGTHNCVATAVETACGVLGSNFVSGGTTHSQTITSASGDIYFVADGISTPMYDIYTFTFEIEQLP